MAALNRVQLLGYVGQEPKITQTKEGKPVTFASLATNASFLKNDEWHTVTEWHHLVLFGKLADLSTRLKKGGWCLSRVNYLLTSGLIRKG